MLATLALTALTAGPGAQDLPHLQDARRRAPTAGMPAFPMLERGRAALDADHPDEAREHLVRALAHHPVAPEILTALVRAAGDDADLRAFWLRRLHRAACGGRGRSRLDRELARRLPDDDAHAPDLTRARIRAVRELLRYAGRLPSDAREPGRSVIAWWAVDLARELLRGCGRAEVELRDELEEARARQHTDASGVIDALGETMTAAAEDDPATALRAARILRGLADQAASPELRGPEPPDLGTWPERAAETLAAARARLAADAGPPLTVDDLAAMDDDTRRAFTAEHATWDRPGRALSDPDGLYLIETTCGHETLRGVAETIELHHHRLAAWFGADPFGDRRGLVRILPEQSGMEGEGTPFWWAGGFQAGDRTTVRFQVGTIAGLGRMLTHELTHRFDGALHAFQPGWLTEGKAVWTAQAYHDVYDREPAPLHVDPGRLWRTLWYGYGRPDRLKELLRGDIEEYRHNYVAGYALFVFLTMGPRADAPLFRAVYDDYVDNLRGGGSDPVGYFTSHFADGEEGRPDGFEAFAGEFEAFCRGFGGEEPEEWTRAYRRGFDGEPRDRQYREWVYDRPTWTWSRANAEPHFGQGQARAAARLFAGLGKVPEAARAGLWSLQVDEVSWDECRVLIGQLASLERETAAWCLRNLVARRFGLGERALPGAAPHAGRLSRIDDWLGTVAEVLAGDREAGRALAARRLWQDHAAVAARLGRPRLPGDDLPPVDEEHRALLDAPAETAGSRGWHVDWMAGFDRHSIPNHWFVDDEGDLHVGRRRQTRTGLLDRRADHSSTFVRGGHWLVPGTWRLRGRVHFTTSYVRGALVVGYERGDRNLQVAFRWGDFDYSIGVDDEPHGSSSAGIWLRSRWVRDGGLRGALPATGVDLGEGATGFEYDILVDGPQMEVRIAGEVVGSYATPDGSPIEGYVGFRSDSGAFRVQTPTVQRLDRARGARPPATWDGALGLGGADWEQRDALRNRLTEGLPRAPHGVLALWFPDLDYDHRWQDVARAAAADLGDLYERFDLAQLPAVVLPETMPEHVRSLITGLVPEGTEIVEHHHPRDDHFHRVVVTFVDAGGVVRVLRDFSYARRTSLSKTLEHWLTIYGPR